LRGSRETPQSPGGRQARGAARLGALLLLLAAGRVVAAPIDVYAAGDIADCANVTAAQSVAAATARLIPPGSTVLVPGDAIYLAPTLENYRSCYQPTWGAFLATSLVVPGNHDYQNGRADGFLEYFGAATAEQGYFVRRVGEWQVIGLDSNLTGEDRERQLRWLQSTLEANPDARCTLAFWHTPLFSSGPHRGSGAHMQAFWKMLDDYGADLVLNGHEHFYEAFEPLDADGGRVAQGLREFVVGTGGARLYGFWRPPYESRSRIERHGVLHLSLEDGSYAWEFIDLEGKASDPGRATCRRSPGQGTVDRPSRDEDGVRRAPEAGQ